MHSLVSLLSCIYPLLAMHSLLVTFYMAEYLISNNKHHQHQTSSSHPGEASDSTIRRPTQISTHPRANKQGCIKCRSHVPLPVIPTQVVIPEEGGYKTIAVIAFLPRCTYYSLKLKEKSYLINTLGC